MMFYILYIKDKGDQYENPWFHYANEKNWDFLVDSSPKSDHFYKNKANNKFNNKIFKRLSPFFRFQSCFAPP